MSLLRCECTSTSSVTYHQVTEGPCPLVEPVAWPPAHHSLLSLLPLHVSYFLCWYRWSLWFDHQSEKTISINPLCSNISKSVRGFKPPRDEKKDYREHEQVHTWSLPSSAAGPLSAICSTYRAMFWNSLPPRILKPKPLVPLLSSTAWYCVSSPSPDPSGMPSTSSSTSCQHRHTRGDFSRQISDFSTHISQLPVRERAKLEATNLVLPDFWGTLLFPPVAAREPRGGWRAILYSVI